MMFFGEVSSVWCGIAQFRSCDSIRGIVPSSCLCLVSVQKLHILNKTIPQVCIKTSNEAKDLLATGKCRIFHSAVLHSTFLGRSPQRYTPTNWLVFIQSRYENMPWGNRLMIFISWKNEKKRQWLEDSQSSIVNALSHKNVFAWRYKWSP